jgi:two-component system sensor histidine kinase CreC
LSIRSRILLAFVALVGAGLLLMVRLVALDARPYLFGATEDSLAETAVVLASIVEARSADGLSTEDLRATLDSVLHRPLDAQIHSLHKTGVELRVYVTDQRGIVVYDSDGGRAEGEDYSRWRDVSRALRGAYGSRASRRSPSDPYSSVFHVAVPIRRGDGIAGVLSVGKQAKDVKTLVSALEGKIAVTGLLALAAAVGLGLFVAAWITRPIERLAAYARAVGAGQRPPLPALRTPEVAALGRTLESMRDALDGRRDVAGYVRGLTHETKAPLAAIRASAELLEEGLPPEDQRRFLHSIRAEVERLQLLVERLLELSALEARHSLAEVAPVDLAALGREVLESAAPLAAQKGVVLLASLDGLPAVPGDRLLLRQALLNLVHNAIRWTPAGEQVALEGRVEGRRVALSVSDSGAGLPDYALPRAFEKFYSLAPPGESKGSGLGLPFVREVALLHGGEASLANRPEGGARAILSLPV